MILLFSLTTHYLEEVISLWWFIYHDQGEIIKLEPKNLKAELKSDTVTLVSPEILKIMWYTGESAFVKR